ncbi:O-antigen ligase family protein [Caldicellulosiruptoraceae bacterium PP1]
MLYFERRFNMTAQKQKKNAYKKENINILSNNISNNSYLWINYLFLAILSLVVLMSPFYRGLYFDYELLAFQAIIFSLFVAFVIYSFIKEKTFLFKEKFEYLLLLFIGVYFIPFFFAANKRLAIGEFMKYIFYFAIFIMAYRMAKSILERKIILNALFISTLGVAFFGFQASVGLIPESSRPFGMAMNGLFVQNMINSTLQYHNTAGTVLAFGMILGLLLALLNENRFISSLYFGLTSVVTSAFIFTYSRGCYVTLPIALFIMFLMLPREKRISLVFNFVALMIPVVILLKPISSSMNPNSKLKLFLLLFIELLVAFIICLALTLIKNLLNKISNKVYLFGFIIVVIIGIIGIYIAYVKKLLPQDLVSKIASISFKERNFQERLVFYKDGLKIFLKSPIFGYGGGTWVSLYFMYQSYLYFTTQSHNYFLQVLLDTGIIGFGILVYLLYFFYSKVLKAWKQKEYLSNIIIAGVTAATVQLYLHSIWDFDFSLASVQVLLFASLGVLYSVVKEKLLDSEGKVLEIKKPSKVLSPMVAVVCFFLIIISLNFRVGHYNANLGSQALQVNDIPKAYEYLSKAVSSDPLLASARLDYATTLTKLGDQKKDSGILQLANENYKKAIAYDRFNSRIRMSYGAFLLSHGDIENGLKEINNAIKFQPLKPYNYEIKADAYAKVGDYYLSKGEKEKAKGYYKVVLEIPKEIEKLKKEREKIPKELIGQEKITPFETTQRTLEIVNYVNQKVKGL